MDTFQELQVGTFYIPLKMLKCGNSEYPIDLGIDTIT